MSLRSTLPAFVGFVLRCFVAACCAVVSAHGAGAPPAEDGQSVAPYWNDTWRGWHFYEDPLPAPEETRVPPANPTPRQAPDRRPPELVQFEQLQRRLVEYRNIAIMRPTEANVRRYMELEARVVNQASVFSEVAQRVAWATPELDMTLQGRPVNAQALEVFDRDQLARRGRTVAALGRDHVLFFFFRGDCPYCHAFSPTLEAFQARYGIQIVPISVDGGGLPEFPRYRRDNGIAQTLRVTQVPALFLAQPYSGKITPIGFGVLSESQLLERIATVTSPESEALVPSISRSVTLK
jgi:conjugal transfer pilus assembly protein TraF